MSSREAATLVAISAILNWMAWKPEIGRPNWTRWWAYWVAMSSTAWVRLSDSAAIEMYSCIGSMPPRNTPCARPRSSTSPRVSINGVFSSRARFEPSRWRSDAQL